MKTKFYKNSNQIFEIGTAATVQKPLDGKKALKIEWK